MTDSSQEAFTEDDMARTSIADTPAPKKRGRPPGSRSTTSVPPPGGQTPPGKPQQTPAQVAAAKSARVKKREGDYKKLIEQTLNPLILQGAAMVVPPYMLFQVESTPDQTGVQIAVDPATNMPIPTEWGQRFYVNGLEATIASMTIARLEDIPAGGAIARLAEQALPYALVGGLLLATGMYARRVIGTIGQLRAATQSQVVVVGEDQTPAQ